jgi:hypothetical protein
VAGDLLIQPGLAWSIGRLWKTVLPLFIKVNWQIVLSMNIADATHQPRIHQQVNLEPSWLTHSHRVHAVKFDW